MNKIPTSSYSASECVCSCYININIKYISIAMVQWLKFFFLLNSEHGLWYDSRCVQFESNLEASQIPIFNVSLNIMSHLYNM